MARTWAVRLLALLIVADVAVLLTDPTPLALREFRQAVRIVSMAAYLAGFLAMFKSARHSLNYSEITALPREEKLGPLASISSVLYVGLAGSAEPFKFPPWLAEVDRREIAGRLTARVKHAHAVESQHRGAGHAAPAGGGPAPQ